MTVLESTALVRKATAADTRILADTLARSFYDDPAGRWFFPRASTRLRGLERMFALLFLPHVALPHDETYTTDDLSGGAIWVPPGAEQPGALENLRMLGTMARIWGARLPHALRCFGLQEKLRPHEPHYYLDVLGVSPDRRGRGIGSALLQPVLDRCDRDGLPAYLEATSERNRALYERHGFRVAERVHWPGGGPPLYLMWREPAGA